MLRVKEVAERLGVSRITVWQWRRKRADFPKPIQLSGRMFVWDEAELNAWLEARRVAPATVPQERC
jgi:excisionase family DNA binding protein